jgi:predicted glycoside hydrolase/deacetylase ChbG (UPF0249 family)
VPLIINADDFGLTPGVNRSVVELHRAGVLSSATLMATGGFFEEAAALARATPTLEVGCHIQLVDGVPALQPAQVPSLCPSGERFRASLGRFVADLQLGRISAKEIEAEATSQIRRLQDAGLRVSHVDTHKHTHLLPRVMRPLLKAARACDIAAIRNPFEPEWARRAASAAFGLRRFEVALAGGWRRAFLRLVRQAGLATTAGTLGVLATGTADVPGALRSLLGALPPGPETWELVCHPGYPDEHLDRVATRLRASRAQEHAALLEQIPGITLATWRGLAGTPSGQSP